MIGFLILFRKKNHCFAYNLSKEMPHLQKYRKVILMKIIFFL